MRSTVRTLEQERAKKAWDFVSTCLDEAIRRLEKAAQQEQDKNRRERLQKRIRDLQNTDDGHQWKAKYGTLVRKMPSYILTNGLGQTLAFLKARGRSEPDSEHEILYEQLSGWLRERLSINDDILGWIIQHADSRQYRYATMETLAFLQWLKRFAEAILPKGREE